MIHDDFFAGQHHGHAVIPVDFSHADDLFAATVQSTSIADTSPHQSGHDYSGLMSFINATPAGRSAASDMHSQISAFIASDAAHAPTKDQTANTPYSGALLTDGDTGGMDGATGPAESPAPADSGDGSSGGCNSGDPNCVEIPGQRPQDEAPAEPSGPPTLPYSGDGSAPTGGSAPPDPKPCEPVHSSPTPALAPNGVNVNALRNMVDDLANKFDGMGKEGDIEHGVLIYADAAGHLRAGTIFTGDSDKVTMSYEPQAGERIVGWLHSHPLSYTVEERFMSSSDVTQMQNLINSGRADPNMLSYIKDNDSGTAGVYEYQSNYRSTLGQQPKEGREVTHDVKPGTCAN